MRLFLVEFGGRRKLSRAVTPSRLKIAGSSLDGDTVKTSAELVTADGASYLFRLDFTCPDPAGYIARARPFLLMALLPAMKAGASLEVNLPVDRITLANLLEWQGAMASWYPGILKVIPIHAPELVEPVPSTDGNGSIACFSGGVDSAFTAFRHAGGGGGAGFHSWSMKAGLMVHGFDIKPAHTEEFEREFANSKAALEALGIPAYRLFCNFREHEKQMGLSWGKQSHGILLAAALSCYEPFFERGLIPSTFIYPWMEMPWGSSPVTDHLLGSATFPIWHDGATQSKLGKVRELAAQAWVRKYLRVCWEGPRIDSNCGRCFKCVLTQMCFWIAGVPELPAFPKHATLADVSRLKIKTRANRLLIASMAKAAGEQGLLPLETAMRSTLRRHEREQNLSRIRETIRRLFRR